MAVVDYWSLAWKLDSCFHVSSGSPGSLENLVSHEYTTRNMLTAHHYSYVIINPMASQITGVSIVYPTVCSGADQRKHQSWASLAFVWEIHRWPMTCPHKVPVTRKIFPFDDVTMAIVCVLLWLGTGRFYPYPSGLLHWHWGNLPIAPAPVKHPWRIWVNDLHESSKSDVITT